MSKYIPLSILITGASSGLGKALALQYAHKGITLHLCGRNQENLMQVAGECLVRGAQVYTYIFDTTDANRAQKAILKANQTKKLDLVIANAGISGGVLGKKETDQTIRKIIETNFLGCLNTVLPALQCMRKRHQGQIALIASLAGYRGMASCPAYSSSKAAVKAFGEALYGEQKNGIFVSTICPGFIKTPLTDRNQFYMPFLMQPDKAANIIKTKLEHKSPFIAFPCIMAFSAWIGSCLPNWLARRIYSLLPKKEK